MTKFYFIRHGETDWNVEGRFQGIENIPLNENGRNQARECGKMLEAVDIPFDCIATSPLDRAVQTAEEIADCLAINKIIKEEALIERDFGKISGKKREDRDYLLLTQENLEIEAEEKVSQRMLAVMKKYCKMNYKHVIFVSHGASIRAVLSLFCDRDSKPAREVQKNTNLSTILFDQGRFVMEEFDKTPLEYVAETVNVRIMTGEDYEGVKALWLTIKGFAIRTIDDSKEGVEAFIRRNPTTSIVAEVNGKIVGSILCGHDGRRGCLYHVCVHEAHRMKGIGKAMVSKAMSALKDENITKVSLIAFTKNDVGNAFWKQIGWIKREDLNYYEFSLNENNITEFI